MEQLKEFQKKIGYQFQQEGLLRQALTHSSYANEHKMNRIECNERLEFLGDAVLELVSSEHLFAQFPPIQSIKVRITKENPPINGHYRSVGIELERSR